MQLSTSRPAGCAVLVPLTLAAAAVLTSGCEQPALPPAAPLAVTAVTTVATDLPMRIEFVAQTASSRQVEIRARIDGFLEERLYDEGSIVKAGQVLFQMDRRPFEAQLQATRAELAQQLARLETSAAELARVEPLSEAGALSQKDLDDAVGANKSAAAAVEAARAKVLQAELNLGYRTIRSPVTGASSFAKKQVGSYIAPGADSLLTYVAALDPIRVDFSVSENQYLRFAKETAAGRIRAPESRSFEVEIELADGSVFPSRGRMTFTDAAFSTDTGTYLIRAEIPNSEGLLRPGQFVRARLIGAVRPDAIVVPQRAVMQTSRGSFAWILGALYRAMGGGWIDVADALTVAGAP